MMAPEQEAGGSKDFACGNTEPPKAVHQPPQKALRLSINPTYDSRKTGPRFEITTFVNDRFIDVKPLADPFVRHTVRVSILDALRSILRRGSVVVSLSVNGHPSIVEDVMELDANYIGHGSTRRAEWKTSMETALREVANDNSVLSGGNV